MPVIPIQNFSTPTAMTVAEYNPKMQTVIHVSFCEDMELPTRSGAAPDTLCGSNDGDNSDMEVTEQAVVSPGLWARFQRLTGRTVNLQSEKRFWVALRRTAVPWLIDRLKESREMHENWQIGAILASMPDDQLPRILRSLSFQKSAQAAEVLLSVIGSAGARPAEYSSQINSILHRYLRHPDDSVRSQAASAVSALDNAAAVNLLRDALVNENDADVRRAIEEEIAERHN
jgi:hypothetical protein